MRYTAIFLFRAWISLAVLATSALLPVAYAQTCPFDDGNSSITREGLILTRFALGLRGAALVNSTDIDEVDAPTVEATVLCPSCGLDINGNGGFDVVDATIISRKIAGYTGAALTDGLNLGSGTRNTPAAVQSFLLAGCGATGGTVTSVVGGTGLTGGTITSSGTLAIAPPFRLPQACSNNQYARYNSTTNLWECVTPNAVVQIGTGAGLTGGPITSTGTIAADTAYLQRRVSSTCATGSSIRAIAVDGTVTCETAPSLGNAWTQGGNAFGSGGVLGTNDAMPLSVTAGATSLSLNIAGLGGLRLMPASHFAHPNAVLVQGGSLFNSVAAGAAGATIAGGGSTSTTLCTPNANCANSVVGSAEHATIGGGRGNTASAENSTIGGGDVNTASGLGATVVGGSRNQAAGSYSTVMGRNAASRNWGQVAHAGNGFGAAPNYTAGNSQYTRMVLSYTSASGVAAELLADGTTNTIVTEKRLRFYPTQSAFIDATVFAKQTGASEAKAWSIKCIVMVDAAGAVTFSPSPCLPTVQQQTSALTWNVTVDALTVGTEGVVRIRQAGVNGVPIRWVATVHMTEVME